MNTRIIPALLGTLLFSGVAEAAPSIYPVDTARFLGGSRFDFKVEFDGELAEKDAKVLINGQDAKAVLGAKPEFIAKEKGADASALLLRGAIAAAVFLVLGLVSYGRAKNDLILYV